MDFEAQRRAVRLERMRTSVRSGVPAAAAASLEIAAAALAADAAALSPEELFARGCEDVRRELEELLERTEDMTSEGVVAAVTEISCRPVPWDTSMPLWSTAAPVVAVQVADL